MTKPELEDVVRRYKALGHPARLRLAMMLRQGELCVCQMIAVLGLAASTVSAHLKELRRAGLLAERKQGRWVYSSLTGEGAEVVGSLAAELDGDAQLAADAEAVERLRREDPEELCRLGPDRARLDR